MTVQRTDLFPTPIWTTDLTHLADQRDGMAAAAREVLAASPASPADPLSQSAAVLQNSDHPGWQSFFEYLRSTMEDIVGKELPPAYATDGWFLRSWVVEVSDYDDWHHTGLLRSLHAHLPSLLSSVLYVEVPEALRGADSGGTTFRDPMAAITGSYRPSDVHVSPQELRLVIFPSWLEHLPQPPDPGLRIESPRLVVATDLRARPA